MGLSVLIHGGPGTGKSTLSESAPGPRIVLDSEGGGEWRDGKVITWSNMASLPDGIDAGSTVLVPIITAATLDKVFQWLHSGKHPFRSAIMDSLSEVQKRVADSVPPNSKGETDWITIQRVMGKIIRDFKDLKVNPIRPLDCVVFITGTQENKAGIQVPSLSGKLAEESPHYVDLTGYTTLAWDEEIKDMTQWLQIVPMGAVMAKDRTKVLSRTFGPSIKNPNLVDLINTANQAKAAS